MTTEDKTQLEKAPHWSYFLKVALKLALGLSTEIIFFFVENSTQDNTQLPTEDSILAVLLKMALEMSSENSTQAYLMATLQLSTGDSMYAVFTEGITQAK